MADITNISAVKIENTQYGINASTVDGHTVEVTGISSNTTTLPTTAQVKSYIDTQITNLKDGRITDLEDETSDLYSITDDLQTQITDNKDELKSMIEDESTVRSTGDTNTLTSAKAYTDEMVSSLNSLTAQVIRSGGTHIVNTNGSPLNGIYVYEGTNLDIMIDYYYADDEESTTVKYNDLNKITITSISDDSESLRIGAFNNSGVFQNIIINGSYITVYTTCNAGCMIVLWKKF